MLNQSQKRKDKFAKTTIYKNKFFKAKLLWYFSNLKYENFT